MNLTFTVKFLMLSNYTITLLTQVVKNACTTIGGIIYADEMCGLQLLSDDQSIPTILDAFKKHSSNQEVSVL